VDAQGFNGEVIDEEKAHYEIEEKDVLWYEISNEGETHPSSTTRKVIFTQLQAKALSDKGLSYSSYQDVASRRE